VKRERTEEERWPSLPILLLACVSTQHFNPPPPSAFFSAIRRRRRIQNTIHNLGFDRTLMGIC